MTLARTLATLFLVASTAAISGAVGASPSFAHGADGAAAPAPDKAAKLVIKGSDTLGAKLVPQLAEAYRAAHPEVTFEIAAEGSTTGITALIDGSADIGMSSREAKPTELSQAKVKGVNMLPTVVSYDAIAVIVNASNPLPELTQRQVEQVFTGDVKDWSAVGGPAGAISVYTRNTSSGTYQDWKSLAMNKRDYAASSQKLAGSEQIASEVANNPASIGYVGLAYAHAEGVKIVNVRTREGKIVTPSPEAVHAGDYPYARPNFFYTNGVPTGACASFIDFVVGPAGQDIVSKSGFIRVSVGKGD